MQIIQRGLTRRTEQSTPAFISVVTAWADELVQNGNISQHKSCNISVDNTLQEHGTDSSHRRFHFTVACLAFPNDILEVPSSNRFRKRLWPRAFWFRSVPSHTLEIEASVTPGSLIFINSVFIRRCCQWLRLHIRVYRVTRLLINNGNSLKESGRGRF
jgi:hypothetical protein